MKPFYGIDRTTLKKNIFHEGDCFVAATVSDMTRQSYERAIQTAAKQLESTRLNPVLRFLNTACKWTTLMIFIGIVRALGNVTVAEAFENVPGLFYAMGGCAGPVLCHGRLCRCLAGDLCPEPPQGQVRHGGRGIRPEHPPPGR